MISKEEKERRMKAVAYAEASGAMEGFFLSEEIKLRTNEFINGEISLEELFGIDIK